MKQKFVWFIKVLFGAILLCLFSSCLNKPEKYALKVNGIEVSEDQLHYDLDAYTKKMEGTGKDSLSERDFEQWLQEYIDQLLLFDQGVKKGIADRADIKRELQIILKRKLVDESGYYYKTITEGASKLPENTPAIWRKYNAYTYEFETILVPATSVTDASIPKLDISHYNILKLKAPKFGFSVDTIRSQYPFNEMLGIDKELVSMKPGDVAGPLLIYNKPYKKEFVYVRCLSKASSNQDLSGYKDGEIWAIMHNYETPCIFNALLYKIYDESKCKLNDSLVSQAYKTIVKDDNWVIDTVGWSCLLDKTALEYGFKDSLVIINFRNFAEFFNKLPIKYAFENYDDFAEYFLDMMIYEYLWEDARTRGIQDRPDELLYRNKLNVELVSRAYLNEFVYHNIVVVDTIATYSEYKRNIKKFTHPGSIRYSEYKFSTFEQAVYFQDSLSKSAGSLHDVCFPSLIHIKGCVDSVVGETILWDDLNKPSAPQFAKELALSSVSQVYKKDAMFHVAVRTMMKGQITIPFHEVSDILFQELTWRAKQKCQDQALSSLRKKAQISRNIKLSEYLK